ncbi:MAG TPA: hypothetical protein VMZ53_18725 [Kofleriaceae bacterium]|nr:hypothetical protein [Kofleriaceae bacterium]
MRVHLALLLAVAACGDDSGGTNPDAPLGGNGDGGDGSMDVPCSYTEMSDPGNASSTTPEVTNITFATKAVLCGKVDTGHFDATEQQVDQDIYKLTFAADTDLIIHFTGAASGLDELAVQVAQTAARAGYGSWTHDHGALVAHVTAGDWYVTAGAFKASDATAAFPYKIVIETDTPGRCAHLTTGGFTEAGDGTNNVGNDMIEYDSSADPTKRLTTGSTDTPEATGVLTAPGMQYRLTGTAANVNASDDYQDRDTYEFMTDAATNELSVRLNWDGTTRDFDFLAVPQNSVKLVGAGLDNATTADEFETFAVKPSSTYWIWVGAYDGAALPTNYDITVCASTYTP